MRSAVYHQFGSPPSVLQVVDRALPEPGPGEVRLRLSMSAIHNHDLMTISGHYGYKPTLPAYPGTEAVGVVDAVGQGVSNLAVGQRVTGGSATWAEYYLGKAASLVPLPDSIPDEIACQLISMPISAKMLLEQLKPAPGDWIIQNAANGAVGKLLAQFAAEQGVKVVNLVRRADAVTELAEIGIGNAVSTESTDWRGQVAALTGSAPIRFGLESVGGRAADELLSVMSDGATLISFGALSGRPLQVSPDNLLFKQARIHGFWLARVLPATDPKIVGRLIGEIVATAARGDLQVAVASRFRLDQVAEAAAAAAAGGRRGKVVLVP